MHSLVEIVPEVLLKKTFKCHQFYCSFAYIAYICIPLGKPPGLFFGLQFFGQFLQGVLALHLNNTNLNSSTQECFMPRLVKISQVVLEKKMRTWRDKNNEEDGQRTELAWDISSGELKTDEIHTFVKSTALDNGQFQRLPIAKMLKVKKTNIVIPVERSNSH